MYFLLWQVLGGVTIAAWAGFFLRYQSKLRVKSSGRQHGKTAPWKDTKPSIGPHFTMHYTAPPAPVQLLFQSLLVSPTPPRICYSHAPETGTKRKWATEIIPPSGP
ncbi:hypothetical protein EYZ11_013283 [Aspergillus tanneri]|uniref:Uncharacterized protein n=1 Tax=Aspergillus tanneri TaxID=1220188 RepID=A0A4S3IYK2_9EURO|nr:hypothetical protein EYZ11_013283 [Aspergillus tanneri]